MVISFVKPFLGLATAAAAGVGIYFLQSSLSSGQSKEKPETSIRSKPVFDAEAGKKAGRDGLPSEGSPAAEAARLAEEEVRKRLVLEKGISPGNQ